MSSDRPSYRIPFAIVLGLTMLSGVVHGFLDGRWSALEDQIAIGERLQDLPDNLGDWHLTEVSELDEGAREMLRCYGSAVRLYQNQKTNAVVNVAVLYGPRGPIAVHTPEACYPSVGTKQAGPTRRESISTATARHEFWSVQFYDVPDPTPTVDVWYAWSEGDRWIAGNYPRLWLTENLYKIQVAGPVADAQNHCADFLEEFLPHVQRVIGTGS